MTEHITKFEHCYGKDKPHIIIEITNPDANIEDTIEAFKLFLLAMGFHPETVKQHLDEP